MSLTEDTVLNMLKDSKIIKNGHFLLRSGLHSDTYIQKDDILIPPYIRNLIVDQIVTKCVKFLNLQVRNRTGKYEDYVITGPATAGSSFAILVADKLELPFVYCEKENLEKDIIDIFHHTLSKGTLHNTKDYIKQLKNKRKMVFRPNFAKFLVKPKNKKVIIVEDIITTGGSVDKTIEAVNKCGATVDCIVSIWNRGNYEPINSLIINSLINKNVVSYKPEDCPMCKNNIELTTLK